MLKNNKVKKKIIVEYQRQSKDTGSSEVQIALLTNRISSLIGMVKLISRRKNLLSYLKKENLKKYEEIIKKLNLRK